jgi:hypothetical protein
MTATSTPTLSNMRDVAALIADDARENLAGVDVISIGPLHAAEPAPGGTRYSVSGVVSFQLPTISAPPIAPNTRSVKRDNPLHITTLPGAGSLARFR